MALSMPMVCVAQDQPSDSTDWDLLLDDVVVTATYAPTNSNEAIHEIRVIDKVDIQRLQARNLKQLLRADASLRIQEDRLLGSKSQLLGIGGQNVKIMIDGVPVIGRVDGNIDMGQIHLDDVEQVEIVEGPLSVNYGTDALAGVINIITKKSQLDKFQVQLDAATEEKGEQSVSAFIGFRPTKKIFLKVNGGYDEFKGYDTDTTRESLWKPKEQKFGGAVVRFIPNEKHDFKYSYNLLDETVTDLGDIRRPQFKPYAFDGAYHTLRQDHVVHYDGSYKNNWYTRAFVAYNSYRRQIDAWRTNFDVYEEIPNPSEQDTNLIESYNARVTLSHQPVGGKFQFQAGIDSRYDRNEGDRIVSPDDSTNSSFIIDNAFFGSARYLPNKHLTIETGLRYAINNRFDAPLIPSLNVRYQLNDHWTFRGSYGKGFRSPDIKELFFNFIDVNHFIVGNSKLVPEKSDNFQLGLTYYRAFRGQEVTFGLRGFYNDIQDKIDLFEYVDTPDGIKPAVDTITNNYTYFNLESFRSAGLSSRFGFDTDRWRLRVGYTLTGRYNPGLESLPGDNKYAFTNEISFSGRYLIPTIETEVSALIRYYDREITYYPDVNDQGEEILGQRIQDGFTIVDMFLSRSFWTDRITLSAGVRNIFDITSTRTTGVADGAHGGTQVTSQAVSTGRRFFARMTFNIGWE